MGNSELPGRLQPMWPPRHDEAETEARPGLKYTEAGQSVGQFTALAPSPFPSCSSPG